MMIVFIVFFITVLIGIYGIYIGLETISQLLFPFSVLKVNHNLSQEEIENFRNEWMKYQKGSKLLILPEGYDYKQYLNI